MVAVYRVTNARGETVAEFPVGPLGSRHSYLRALARVAPLDGKIFHVSEHGELSLVFGRRERPVAWIA